MHASRTQHSLLIRHAGSRRTHLYISYVHRVFAASDFVARVVQDEGYDLLATEVPEGEAAEGEQPNGYDGLNGEGAQEGDLVNGE